MSHNAVPQPSSYKKLPPSPEIIDALTNVDYSPDAAIADLIDNSIDAGCSTVLVRIVGTSSTISHLLIVDDGRGIAPDQIDDAMSFAKRRKYGKGDLGLYGMGLKSASLSQATMLTLYSRSQGAKAVGRRWTIESARNDFRCGVMSDYTSRTALAGPWIPGLDTRTTGTVVRWDDVKRFRQAHDNVDKYIRNFYRTVGDHLGMVFHRLLSTDRLSIVLDYYNTETRQSGFSRAVTPLDPFDYPRSANRLYPAIFTVRFNKAAIKATCHIWPKGQQKNPHYKLIGNIAQRQGLYLYRNNRLIQAGGWNGARMDGEPHLSLARVEIDLPPAVNDTFQVRYTKSSVDVPTEFVEALKSASTPAGATFDQYIADAQGAYRSKAEPAVPKLNAATGLPAHVLQAVRATRQVSKGRAFKIRFGRVPRGEFFHLDIDAEKLTISKPLLDGATKDELRNVIATLTYLLLQDRFTTQRVSATSQKMISSLSKIAASAVQRNS